MVRILHMRYVCIVDPAFRFLHVEVLIIFCLYEQKLIQISGILVNANFVTRAIGTRAKRLATSLAAELEHVFVPHSTKLLGSKRLINFLTVLPPHIVHLHIVYVHHSAIRLLAAMMSNSVLHPFQSLLFSFCTFCLVGVMIIYCS